MHASPPPPAAMVWLDAPLLGQRMARTGHAWNLHFQRLHPYVCQFTTPLVAAAGIQTSLQSFEGFEGHMYSFVGGISLSAAMRWQHGNWAKCAACSLLVGYGWVGPWQACSLSLNAADPVAAATARTRHGPHLLQPMAQHTRVCGYWPHIDCYGTSGQRA